MKIDWAPFEQQWPGITKHPGFPAYAEDLVIYWENLGGKEIVKARPQLNDAPVDLYYFHQDLWAAHEVLRKRPTLLVDVGSTALLVGLLAIFVPTVALDIRPFAAKVPNLLPMQADIKELPFADESLEMLTSMCMIEHVGLGRYGGELDTQGSARAFAELRRVIRPGGSAIFSVPLASDSWVDFNAHRVFTKPQVMDYLPGFTLEHESFFFPYPGREDGVRQLKPDCYCVWCAHMVKD